MYDVLAQGVRIIRCWKKLSKKSVFIKQSWKSKSITSGILIRLEIKHHTVPHLKGLTSGLESSGNSGHGSTFTLHQITLNCTHLHSSTDQMMISSECSYISKF